jgi:hypothetical protein
MEANLQLMSPETMMQSWMSIGTQAQDAFMKLMQTGTSTAMRSFTEKP